MSPKRDRFSKDDAEALALEALAFLAEEPERLGRFLSLTGLGPAELRAGMTTPDIQAAVIGHLRSDESLLLVFAATTGTAPERLAEAERLLDGGIAS